jgi:hypothetical protein
MAVQVKVSGINILLKDLDQYSEKVQAGIYKEVRDWAERTEADAKRDVAYDTGALQSTIRSVVSNNGLTWIVKAGGIKGVNYAPYIEFGTGTGVDQGFLQEYGLVKYARFLNCPVGLLEAVNHNNSFALGSGKLPVNQNIELF